MLFRSPIQGKVYGDEEGNFLRYLESEYKKIEPIEDYPVFVLEQGVRK